MAAAGGAGQGFQAAALVAVAGGGWGRLGFTRARWRDGRRWAGDRAGGLGFRRARRCLGAVGGGAGLEAAQGAQGAADVAVDAAAVAAERLQALQAGRGDDLLGIGGGQRLELEPAQALLAPQGGHQLGGPVALEGVAWVPVGGDGALEQGQLLAVLAGEETEVAAAQAVPGAVLGGTGLAGLGGGAVGAGAVGAARLRLERGRGSWAWPGSGLAKGL